MCGALRHPPSLLVPPPVVYLCASALLLVGIAQDMLGAQVRGACYARANPTPMLQPAVVAASDEALRLLDLAPDEVSPRGWRDGDCTLYISFAQRLGRGPWRGCQTWL